MAFITPEYVVEKSSGWFLEVNCYLQDGTDRYSAKRPKYGISFLIDRDKCRDASDEEIEDHLNHK